MLVNSVKTKFIKFSTQQSRHETDLIIEEELEEADFIKFSVYM